MVNKKGFTLIEMLVVVAIVGILSAVVLTSLGPARNKAKDTRIISGLNQARAIAETLFDGDYDALPQGVVPLNDQNFGQIAQDIKNQGGELKVNRTTGANSPAYAFWSNLTNLNEYYCVDSAGRAMKVDGDRQNPSCLNSNNPPSSQ